MRFACIRRCSICLVLHICDVIAFMFFIQEDCFSCSTRPVMVELPSDALLQDLYNYLTENQNLYVKCMAALVLTDFTP